MSHVNGVMGSLAGGAVGALTWAGVSYGTDHEIGWIAWGIGALAGLGMFLGLKGQGDRASGAIAALIAVAAVFAGKYTAVHFAAQKWISEIEATPVDSRAVLVHLADQVVEEWQAEGRDLAWPSGMTIAEVSRPEDYPGGVWEQAEVRFDASSAADRSRLKSEVAEQRSAMLRGMNSEITTASFKESFGPHDLLWAALAVATAFRIASRRRAEAPEAAAA